MDPAHAKKTSSPDPAADLQTASAEMLAERFPTLGLFAAEDVVAWRDTHGRFPEEQMLVSALGVPAALAAEVTRAYRASAVTGGERTSATYAAGTVLDFSDDPPAAVAPPVVAVAPARVAPPAAQAYAAGTVLDFSDDPPPVVGAAPCEASVDENPAGGSLIDLSDDPAVHDDEGHGAAFEATSADAAEHAAVAPGPAPASDAPRRRSPPPLPPDDAGPPSSIPMALRVSPQLAGLARSGPAPSIADSPLRALALARACAARPPESEESGAGVPPGDAVAAAPQVAEQVAHRSAAPAEPSLSPDPPAPPPAAEPAKPAAEARHPPRRRAVAALVAVLFAVNAGVVVGLVRTRSEGRTAVAPIVSISADVKVLKAGQVEARAELAEARARLDETRKTLAKQETVLLGTVEAVNQSAARQKIAERELKELDTREARDVGALASRMRLAEKRAADGSYALTLSEAVKLIDAVQGPAPRGPSGTGDTESAPHAKPEQPPRKAPAIH